MGEAGDSTGPRLPKFEDSVELAGLPHDPLALLEELAGQLDTLL